MKSKDNIKKFIVIMLSLVMVVTMFAACGQKKETAETEKAVIGMLPVLNATEEDLTQTQSDLGRENTVVKFYDDINSMILALQGDKIICIGRIPEPTAMHIANNNPEFTAHYRKIDDKDKYLKYSMGFNNDKKGVADKVQAALDEMKSDGTLDKLSAEYIDAFVEGGEPAAVEMPVIAGAETIEIVVTGDLPPFDYISADGKPCGFNTAMLAELSKRIGINIELVSTNSAGRAAALSSGKADGLFYVAEWSVGDAISNSDCPEGMITVGPFYESKSYSVWKAKEE